MKYLKYMVTKLLKNKTQRSYPLGFIIYLIPAFV